MTLQEYIEHCKTMAAIPRTAAPFRAATAKSPTTPEEFAAQIGGWFCEQNRTNLDRLIKKHHVKRVLEIGSFLGLSAAWFAQHVEHVTCIDLWREEAIEDSRL